MPKQEPKRVREQVVVYLDPRGVRRAFAFDNRFEVAGFALLR